MRSARSGALRGGLVLGCVVAVGLGLGGCGKRARPGVPPRNLVLVTVGGVGADHLGPYLYGRPTTSLASDPSAREEGRAMGLDDLASAGVVFAHCCAPSPRTVPSLASLFTGLSPVECGVTDDDDGVPDDVATIAELFAHDGFRTAAFVTSAGDDGAGPDLEGAFGRGFAAFTASEGDAATLAAASEWARHDQGDGSRRFLWIHLLGPDRLWTGTPAGAGREEVEAALSSRSFGPEASAADVARFAEGAVLPGAEERAALRASCDREIARAMLGVSFALRDAFDYYESNADASETWARTVFVMTSPCGSESGEDGVGHVGSLKDAVLHVPLVIRHPDSLTGERVIADVVELEDVLPTLVEWFDLATPARVKGRSLLSRLDSRPATPFVRRPAITSLPGHVFSVRDERFHMVWNPLRESPEDRPLAWEKIPTLALYEPDRDPLERIDVAAEHMDVVVELQEEVRVWRDRQQAYPLEKKRPASGILKR